MVEVIRSLSLAYVPIRKVGTTSIRKAFRALARETGDFEATYDRPMSAYVRFRARDCRTFVVVRDPVERFLSAYANRIHHHDDISAGAVDRSIARMLGLPRRPDIEEFCDRFQLYCLSNDKLRRHFRLQKAYLGSDLDWFDHIYRLDETDRLAADLSEWSGQPVTFERLQTGGPKLRFGDVPAGAQRRILAITAPDYRLLSGYFAPPEPG